jgi:hypothetical protein
MPMTPAPISISEATLERIAGMHGIAMPDESDRDGVVADWHEGQRRGVLGSSHFFCADENAFCPSLDIIKDADHNTKISFNSARLLDFLDRCFAQQTVG